MDDGYWPVWVMVLAVFILMDAVLYGFGAAIQNMNVNRLEKEAQGGNRRAARILAIMDHPGEFINTVQVVTNLIGIAAGAYVLNRLDALFRHLAGNSGGGHERLLSVCSVTAAGILILAVVLSFGVIIPKKCAAKKPERWGYGVFPAVNIIVGILRPFTALVCAVSSLVLRPMGIDANAPEDNVTEEDIMLMVNEGHEQGVLEAGEAEMITNIFELSDKEAGDIMTHRTNVVALDASMTLDEAVSFILTEAVNSRFPVYDKDMDDIIGILHMRDALMGAEQKENRSRRLSEIPSILREAHFIPETRHINTLFQEMQSRKIHMEIVVDEYGQTAGIVTMEDILEEIVGNILDEYDEDEEFVSRREDGSTVFDGRTPLDEVAEALGLVFEKEDEENYDTINGFLISRLDRIPREGEQPEIRFGNYLFRVLSVKNKMIQAVLAIPEKNAGNDGEDE